MADTKRDTRKLFGYSMDAHTGQMVEYLAVLLTDGNRSRLIEELVLAEAERVAASQRPREGVLNAPSH